MHDMQGSYTGFKPIGTPEFRGRGVAKGEKGKGGTKVV
jgi:hypothetical protein